MSSFYLSFVIVLLLVLLSGNLALINPFKFGFEIIGSIFKDNVATITVYWNYTPFQCNVRLSKSITKYDCNILRFTTTECDPIQMNMEIPQYGMQIDSNSNIEIKSLYITTNDNYHNVAVEYFCIDNTKNCSMNNSNDTIIITPSAPSVSVIFEMDPDTNYANSLSVGYATLKKEMFAPYCIEVSAIIFGFHTQPSWHSVTDDAIILTLTWNGLKYQCVIYPLESDQYYQCDTSNTHYTRSCDFISEDDNSYTLQIDNKHNNNPVFIDEMVIELIKRNIIQKMKYFCVSSTDHVELADYTHFIDNKCVNNGSYDVIFVHEHYFQYGLIDLTPTNLSAVYVKPIEESAMCLPDLSNRYILVALPKVWIEAQNYCQNEYKSDLATIITDQDLYAATASTQQHYSAAQVWIGLNDRDEEGNWVWIDKTSCGYAKDGMCINDEHWVQNEPNDDFGEDCSGLRHEFNGLFNDYDCSRELIFLCNNNSESVSNHITKKNTIAGFQITALSATLLNASNGENYTSTITFVSNDKMYQCNVQLIPSNTYYYCNTSNLITTQCNTDEMKLENAYSIQINSNVNIELESLFMITDGDYFKIERFWVDGEDNSSDSIIIDELYPSILVTFDINHHNAEYTNLAGYSVFNQIAFPPNCVEESTMLFGFKTAESWNAGITDKIILSLIWNKLVYQCTKYAVEQDSKYLCNTSNIYHTRLCNESMIEIVYGLQIDNLGDNALGIDEIIIENVDRNITYIIDYFCFNASNNTQLGDSTYFTDDRCFKNLGYDVMFIDSGFFHHGLINLTPTDMSQEAFVDVVDKQLICLPELENKYILVLQPKSWKDAQTYCQMTYDSSLATIQTDEDLTIAIAMKNSANYMYTVTHAWIGLNDINKEGNWVWADGTSCDYAENGLCKNDKHWGSHQPDNSKNEHCAVLYELDGFFDRNCDQMFIFYCNNNGFTTSDISQHKLDPIVIIIIIAVIFVIIAVIMCYYIKRLRAETNKSRYKIVELEQKTSTLENNVRELQEEVSSIKFSHPHVDNSTDHNMDYDDSEGAIQQNDGTHDVMINTHEKEDENHDNNKNFSEV